MKNPARVWPQTEPTAPFVTQTDPMFKQTKGDVWKEPARSVDRSAPCDVEWQGEPGHKQTCRRRVQTLIALAKPHFRPGMYIIAIGLEATDVWSDWQFLGTMMLPCWSRYRIVLGQVYGSYAVWFKWMSIIAAVVSSLAFLIRLAICGRGIMCRPQGSTMWDAVRQIYDREDDVLHSPKPNWRQLLTFLSSSCSDGLQLIVTVAILTVNPSGALVFIKAGLSAVSLGSTYLNVITIFILWIVGYCIHFKWREDWPRSIGFKLYCGLTAGAAAAFLLLGMYRNQGTMANLKPFDADILKVKLCGLQAPSQCKDVTPAGNVTALVSQRKIAELALANSTTYPNFNTEQSDTPPYQELNGFQRLYTNKETITLQNFFTCPGDSSAADSNERCVVASSVDPHYRRSNITIQPNYYLNVTLRAASSNSCFP